MSQARKSSSLPTVLVVVACAAVAAYFAFFRGKTSPTEPTPAASAEPLPAVKVVVAPEPQPPPPPPKLEPAAKPPPPKPPRVDTSEIVRLGDEGRWRQARTALAAAFAGSHTDEDRAELAKKGVEINQRLLVLQPDEKDIEQYELQQGDTLEGIARKFKSLNGVKGAVMLLNGYKENSILRAGRKVKIARGTWSIVVDKSLFKLYLCYEGAPFKVYPVAIGTDQKTPAAKFTVGVRNPKPAWWPPVELNLKGPVKYGDPQNPLGEWWISLEHDLYHGLGIHGTNDPGSVGSKASNGCVRMLNEEVGEIAAVAFKGMAVAIVE